MILRHGGPLPGAMGSRGHADCRRTNGEAATAMVRVISGTTTAGLIRRSSTLAPTRHSVREAIPQVLLHCDGTCQAPARV